MQEFLLQYWRILLLNSTRQLFVVIYPLNGRENVSKIVLVISPAKAINVKKLYHLLWFKLMYCCCLTNSVWQHHPLVFLRISCDCGLSSSKLYYSPTVPEAGKPMQPVVSAVCSSTYDLAKWLPEEFEN